MDLHQQIKKTAQGLTITPEMRKQARGNKMHLIVKMRPSDFLMLTTTDDLSVGQIRQNCKTLDDYNRFADEGESILMPFLNINGDTGQVKSHEGRHRSAALTCAGLKEMPVSIRITPSDKHDEKYGYFKSSYDMKFEDLPDQIRGQYGRGIVDKKDIRVVVDGWENIS